MSAVVVMGEAPESEEEIDEIDCGFVTVTGNQFTDELINPPESPPSPSPDFPQSKDDLSSATLQRHQQHQKQSPEIQQQKPIQSESSPSTTSNLYDTLLHRKLREKNEFLREELVKVAFQPYLNATKEINSLSQQLIKSQKMIQQVSGTLTKLTKDLKNIEITLDTYRSDSSSVIPPFTNKLPQSSPRKQPDINLKEDTFLPSSSKEKT